LQRTGGDRQAEASKCKPRNREGCAAEESEETGRQAVSELLMLDKYDLHNSAEPVEEAVGNKIDPIQLPAQTPHRLQICDRTLFGPLQPCMPRPDSLG